MIRYTPTFLQYASRVTSFEPPDPLMTVVVRGSYQMTNGGVAEEIADIREQGYLSGHRWDPEDEDRVGEVLYSDDFAEFKPKAEVLLRGFACSPGGEPAPRVNVQLQVGDRLQKTLTVTGDRIWRQAAIGATPGEPTPFTHMLLGWDRAFGGPSNAGNPVGRGMGDGMLPNVEYPAAMVKSQKDQPPPAGFGPISPEWPARRALLGKRYGKEYQQTRAPFYSLDFDWAYFNCAPADQRLDDYLHGDEPLQMMNLHPEHPTYSCRLPGVRPRAFVNDAERNFREVDLVLDTLWIDMFRERVYLTWRGQTPVAERDLSDVTILYVDSEPLEAEPVPAEDWQAVVEAREEDPAGLQNVMPEGFEEATKAIEEMSTAGKRPAEMVDLTNLPADGVDNPVSQLLARLLGGFAPTSQQMLADNINQAGGLCALKGGPSVNQELAKGIANAPAVPPPPAGGAPPQVDLKGVMDQLASMKASLPDDPAAEEMADAIDQLMARPEWAQLDPALAPLPKPGEAAATAEAAAGGDAAAAGAAGVAGVGAMAGVAMMGTAGAQLANSAPPPKVPGADSGPRARRNLRGKDLSALDLTDEDFSGCDLTGAVLAGSVIAGVNFTGATLTHANLHGVNGTGATFRGADMRGATLTSARLVETDLRGANLDMANAGKAFFAAANMEGATLVMAHLDGAQAPGVYAAQVNATDAVFDNGVLTAAVFEGAKLTGASMRDCDAADINLLRADLRGFVAAGAKMDRLNAREATGPLSSWMDAALEGADFSFADLLRALMNGATLTGARFDHANLRETMMRKSRLKGASMRGANLLRTELPETDCTAIDLSGANIYRTVFYDATLDGCRLDGTSLAHAVLKA